MKNRSHKEEIIRKIRKYRDRQAKYSVYQQDNAFM